MPGSPIEVLAVFSQADRDFLQPLERHLSVLQREGTIALWHKDNIAPGENRQALWEEHLNTSTLILLLVSSDLLAADHGPRSEMQQVWQRHESGRAKILPILVRPCDWKRPPLATLQVLPTNEQPVRLWEDTDAAWTSIVESLRPLFMGQTNQNNPHSFTSPPGVWNIPFARNSFFTGCEEMLGKIHSHLHVAQTLALSQPQALSGLGGIGKTQLAIEYAHRYQHEYQAVLWVQADTIEALNASYTELAHLFNLPQRHIQEQKAIVQAVKTWLSSTPGWLLIVDNADEPDLVRSFLPTRLTGHLLLTTRVQSLGELAQPLEIETMDEDTGALLLLRRARFVSSDKGLEALTSDDHALAKKITQDLGGLPLALDQAGAYIEETRCGLAAYQRLYQEERMRLLTRRGGQGLSHHPEPVATTWSLSFAKVEQKSPLARDVLHICALLAPDAIPEDLVLEVLSEQTEKFAAGMAGSLDEAVALLRNYSLLQRNYQQQALSVHRLVQAVLQESMEPEVQQHWLQKLLLSVQRVLPSLEFEHWVLCERYMPHVRACMQLAGGIKRMEEVQTWYWLGAYLLERRRTEEAEPYINQMFQWQEQHLNEEHWEKGAILDRVARLLELQGKYAEAKPLYEQALAIQERQLGALHPDTASSLNNLALLYTNQGSYAQAEPFYKRALAIRERQLGASHPDTASSLNNLAALYKNQGKYAQAEPLYERVLVVRKQQLGRSHPDTASSLNNLAVLYFEQGKYTQAEPLYKQALAIREQQLGVSHPETAGSLNNLALLYTHQGRYAEAEPLYKRVLVIREQQLGASHPETASCLNNLAMLYVEQRSYDQAEPLYERALTICEQHLGASHPEIAQILNNLALLYTYQEKYDQAEPLYERALAIRVQQLGDTHPDTAQSLHNLAMLYGQQKRYEQAELFYKHALAIRERVLGVSHPDTASSWNNLAFLYANQRKYTAAEPYYKRALAIYEQQSGPTHPSTIRSLNNLAWLYHRWEKYAEAEPLYKQLVPIYEQQFGASHRETAQLLNNLAAVYESQEKYAEAMPLYERALKIFEDQLGLQHPTTHAVRMHYGFLLRRKPPHLK